MYVDEQKHMYLLYQGEEKVSPEPFILSPLKLVFHTFSKLS
jgi:hypothetical protein